MGLLAVIVKMTLTLCDITRKFSLAMSYILLKQRFRYDRIATKKPVLYTVMSMGPGYVNVSLGVSNRQI